MKILKKMRVLGGVCTVFLIGSLGLVQAQNMLRVGTISNEYKDELAKWTPFTQYLATQLKKEGIKNGKVVVVSSIEQMVDAFQKKKVDIFIDSPFPVMAVQRKAGTKILLRRWKKGKKEYKSIIFVRKDSGLENLKDLKGKTIVFEDSFSTSGYFLSKVSMLQEGLILQKLKNKDQQSEAKKTGYVFSLDEENSVYWVLEKRVAAAGLSMEDLKKYAGKRLPELKVIYTSKPVPRHIVSYREDLDRGFVKAIEKVLLGMDKSEEGKKILEFSERTKKFDRFPAGIDQTFKDLTSMFRIFEKSD